MSDVYLYNGGVISRNVFVPGQNYRIADSSNRFTDLSTIIVYLTSIDKESGAKTTAVFDNTNGQVLDGSHIYFVKIEDLNANVLVEADTRIYDCDHLPHAAVFGICGDKCQVEVVPKETFENKFATVTKSNIAVTATADTTARLAYPAGFNKDNSVIISSQFCLKTSTTEAASGWRTNYPLNISTTQYPNHNAYPQTQLNATANNISVIVRTQGSHWPYADVKVTLMRTDI